MQNIQKIRKELQLFPGHYSPGYWSVYFHGICIGKVENRTVQTGEKPKHEYRAAFTYGPHRFSSEWRKQKARAIDDCLEQWAMLKAASFVECFVKEKAYLPAIAD